MFVNCTIRSRCLLPRSAASDRVSASPDAPLTFTSTCRFTESIDAATVSSCAAVIGVG
jgi:hypothetical protein